MILLKKPGKKSRKERKEYSTSLGVKKRKGPPDLDNIVEPMTLNETEELNESHENDVQMTVLTDDTDANTQPTE